MVIKKVWLQKRYGNEKSYSNEKVIVIKKFSRKVKIKKVSYKKGIVKERVSYKIGYSYRMGIVIEGL